MPNFSFDSMTKLASCDIDLQLILNEAIEIIDFKVLCGHRGKEEQEKAVREGKSKLHFPNSKHNSLPSKAVDIAPYFKDKPNIDWNDLLAFGFLAGVVKAVAAKRGKKVIWGGDWNNDGRTKNETFLDLPHFEID